MNSHMYDEVLERMRDFLSDVLPLLSEDWVTELVVPYIHPKSRHLIQGTEFDILEQLDLTDILKVAECNWAAIAIRYHFPRRVFGLIKHLQLARNAYAHRIVRLQDSSWDRLDKYSVQILFSYLDAATLNIAA